MIKKIFKTYKKQILYLLFGGLTTIINIIAYFILYNLLHVNNIYSTIISLIICVSTAFITNKIWVFESKSFAGKKFLYEMCSFALCRFTTGVVDVLIMYVFVDILCVNGLIMKIISNIVVIILNYIASQLIIFKKNICTKAN